MTVPVLAGMSAAAADYDALILDLWGVVHDGVGAKRTANGLSPERQKTPDLVAAVSTGPGICCTNEPSCLRAVRAGHGR